MLTVSTITAFLVGWALGRRHLQRRFVTILAAPVRPPASIREQVDTIGTGQK